MPDSWEYIKKIPANAQVPERLATVKRGMNNFGRYESMAGTGGAGNGWDWSAFSYFKTNSAGENIRILKKGQTKVCPFFVS